MNPKKEEARFTIKFNPDNPHHRKAIQILNEAGRGKAALIAEALCMYSQYVTNAVAGVVKRDKPKTSHGIDEPKTMPLLPKLLDTHETTNAIQPTEDDLWQAVNESVESFFDNATASHE